MRMRTGNDFDAHDLVQETLLRVRRGLVTYRPGSMEGWLSRIATNAFFDSMRKKKRRPTVAFSSAADESLADKISVVDEFEQRNEFDLFLVLLDAFQHHAGLTILCNEERLAIHFQFF